MNSDISSWIIASSEPKQVSSQRLRQFCLSYPSGTGKMKLASVDWALQAHSAPVGWHETQLPLPSLTDEPLVSVFHAAVARTRFSQFADRHPRGNDLGDVFPRQRRGVRFF